MDVNSPRTQDKAQGLAQPGSCHPPTFLAHSPSLCSVGS